MVNINLKTLSDTGNITITNPSINDFLLLFLEISIDGHMRMGTRKLKACHAYKYKQTKNFKANYTNVELVTQINIDVHGLNDSNKLHHSMYHEKHLDIQNLFQYCNHVLLRGSRGSGKTYIVDEIISNWVHGNFYTEIKFVFLLNYEEVKDIMYESLEDILRYLYPHVFEEITLSQILAEPKKMLLILDGWSEMNELNFIEYENGLNEMYFHQECDITGWFLEKQNIEESLMTQRVLITSLTDTYDVILEYFCNFEFAVVDIIGFKFRDTIKYVNKYTSNNNNNNSENDKSEALKTKLKKHEYLRNLSRLPSTLNTLCYIYKTTAKLDDLNTLTEIYIWKFLLELKSNNLNLKNGMTDLSKNRELDESFINDITITSITELAQLAYKQKINKRRKKYRIKNETSNYDTIIKNLLTAIFLFISNRDPYEIKEDGRIKDCLPFVAGLHGTASNTNSLLYPSITATFTEAFKVSQNPDFINELFETFVKPSKRRTECYLDNDFLEFLQCYNEFQNYLIEDDGLLNVQINLKLQNLLPQDIDNLIYFLNHERYQLHIFSINIHSFRPISKTQMEELALHLLSIPVVTMDIKSFSKSSSIFVKIFESYQKTKEFLVKLKCMKLTQKNVYDTDFEINLEWLLYMHSFHIWLCVEDATIHMKHLSECMLKYTEKNFPLLLSRLKLTLENTSEDVLKSLLNLIRNFLLLRELEIEIYKNNTTERFMPYSSHSYFVCQSKKAVDSTDVSTIKCGLYSILQEDLPRNLHRLIVRDPYCNYEFLINERNKQIAFVMDNEDEAYVDIDLIKF